VPSDGAVSAELVFSGQPKVRSREELRAELDGDAVRARTLADALAQESLASPHPRSAAAEIALIDRLIDDGDVARRTDAELARVLRALTSLTVRDAQLIDRGPQGEQVAAQFWAGLAGVAPSPWDAAPLTLLAVCAYRRGDGARANVALEAANETDPDYPLAALVGCAMAAAVAPRHLGQNLDAAARRVRSSVC
jgi:hypothetical protein